MRAKLEQPPLPASRLALVFAACAYHRLAISDRTGLMARRLAAILAADVVGYSRLMAADEAGTHARLKALRQDFIEPKIAEHHGRVAKLMGDGVLVEFASVVDAVECAVAIQQGIAERQAELPEASASRSASASTSATSSSKARTSTATGSTSPRGSRGSPSPAGSASPGPSTTRSGQARVGFEPMGEHRVKNIPEPVDRISACSPTRTGREGARAEAPGSRAMAPCRADRGGGRGPWPPAAPGCGCARTRARRLAPSRP